MRLPTARPAAALTAVLLVAIFAAARRARSGDVAHPLPAPAVEAAAHPALDTAVLAGGCFWGVQEVFDHVAGVVSTTAGYAGGPARAATYAQVSSGETGHAESVRIVFDPARITFGTLLQILFSVATDPTQLNRQGPDVGPQYRSVIFYRSDAQRRVAESYIAQLEQEHVFAHSIVTQVVPLGGFYPAEAYHQHYAAHHPHEPYIALYDAPKLAALRKEFPERYRAGAD